MNITIFSKILELPELRQYIVLIDLITYILFLLLLRLFSKNSPLFLSLKNILFWEIFIKLKKEKLFYLWFLHYWSIFINLFHLQRLRGELTDLSWKDCSTYYLNKIHPSACALPDCERPRSGRHADRWILVPPFLHWRIQRKKEP